MIRTVVVIGLGNIAKRHRANLKTIFDGVKVIAVSSSGRKVVESIENADQIANDIEDVIVAKPDFVIVATPATFHAKHSIPLIEAGIPVLIEKPVSASVADALNIQNTACQRNVAVDIGYCLKYLPSTIYMKNLMDDDFLGNIYNISLEVGQYLPDWRIGTNFRKSVSASAGLGGGALLELSHEFDYAQWLFGDLKLKYAILRSTTELNLDVEEIADVLLETTTGAICSVHLDFLQKKPVRKCIVMGEMGRIEWDLIRNTIWYDSNSDKKILYSDERWNKNQMYIDMVLDFANNLTVGCKQNSNLNESVKIISLIEEIKNSAQWGIKA
jgi:predicted dehydrogenase